MARRGDVSSAYATSEKRRDFRFVIISKEINASQTRHCCGFRASYHSVLFLGSTHNHAYLIQAVDKCCEAQCDSHSQILAHECDERIGSEFLRHLGDGSQLLAAFGRRDVGKNRSEKAKRSKCSWNKFQFQSEVDFEP